MPDSNPSSPHFQIELHGRVLVVQFLAPQLFEHLVLNELDGDLRNVIWDYSSVHLVFDFSLVEFCSTSIVGALLQLRRKIQKHNGVVAISGLQGPVDQAFKVLNLDNTVFVRCGTKQLAIDYLNSLDQEDDTADQ